MSFFYDLNKKLNGIGAETKQIAEAVQKAKEAAKTPARKTLEESLKTDLRSLMESQVNEISQDTKDSYTKKAKTELDIYNRNKNNPAPSAKDKEMASMSAARREKGLARMAKEDGTGGMNFSGSGSMEEGEKWIQKAVNPAHKGDLHKALHVPQGEKIPKTKINKAAHSKNAHLRHMAQFAKNVSETDLASAMEDGAGDIAAEGTCPACHSSPCACEPTQRPSKNPFDHVKGGAPKMPSKGIPGNVPVKGKMDRLKGKRDFYEADPSKWSMDPSPEQMPRGERQRPEYYEEDQDIMEFLRSKLGANEDAHPTQLNKGGRYGGKANAYNGLEFEGNAFTGKLAHTPKGGKFELDGNEYKDTSSLEETVSRKHFQQVADLLRHIPDEAKRKELALHHAHIFKQQNPRFDLRKFGQACGCDLEECAMWEDLKGGQKKLDRNHNGKIDAQDFAMLRSGNKVDEDDIPLVDRGEYDQEGDMVKDNLHTIRREAGRLEQIVHNSENVPEWVQDKLAQAKGMITSTSEYMQTQRERGAEHATGEEGITMADEGYDEMHAWLKHREKEKGTGKFDKKKISTGTVYTRKHEDDDEGDEEEGSKKSSEKRGRGRPAGTKRAIGAKGPTGRSKLMTKSDDKAERAGKKVAKDIEHDEGHKAKDDNKAERAGKRVTKDIEYDDKKDRKEKKADKKEMKKEEKVEETTTSGSVAPAAGGKPAKGMGIGKGIYDSIERDFERLLAESVSVETTAAKMEDGNESESLTIHVDGDDVAKIKQALSAMGIGHDHHGITEPHADEPCHTCGGVPCQCDELGADGLPGEIEVELGEADAPVTQNSPDYPTNPETSDDALQYAGGLNKPKSTGQSTIPVLASQDDRQMSESNSFLDLYKTFAKIK